jgi:hypothetical protein
MFINVRSVLEALSEVLGAKENLIEMVLPDESNIKTFSEKLRNKLTNSSYDKFRISDASTESDKRIVIRKEKNKNT